MSTERVVLAIAQCGGFASAAELLALVGRHALRHAAETGVILRVRRGTYTLAGQDVALEAAVRLGGAVSHRSAALRHGWGVTRQPERPELVVPRNREVSLPQRRGLDVRWRHLAREDVVDQVTAPVRTVVDCARDLPLTESLAVADSALRSGAVSPSELRDALSTLPRTGRRQAALVLEQASAQPANPFESATRALSIGAVGPIFVPQLLVTVSQQDVHPDLVCEDLRIVIEADSHEFHTTRKQLNRDCRRYNELTLDGWLVLRFTWDQVMFDQEWVRRTIRRAVELRRLMIAG